MTDTEQEAVENARVESYAIALPPAPWKPSGHMLLDATGGHILNVRERANPSALPAVLALTSAAPDLLEALRDLLAWATDGPEHGPEIDQARAAIAKATGGA